MSVFYDPKSKKPKPWIFVLLILIPILVFAVYIIYGKQLKPKTDQSIQPEEDIFKKL